MPRIVSACTLVIVLLGCFAEDGVSCDFNLSFKVKTWKVYAFKHFDDILMKCVFCIKIKAEANSCTVTKKGVSSVLDKENLGKVLDTPKVNEDFYFYLRSAVFCPPTMESKTDELLEHLGSSISEDAKKVGASWTTKSMGKESSGIQWSVLEEQGTASADLKWKNPDKKMMIEIFGYEIPEDTQLLDSDKCGNAVMNYEDFHILVRTPWYRRDRVMV